MELTQVKTCFEVNQFYTEVEVKENDWISIKAKYKNEVWQGKYGCREIEELTREVGSFKTFGTFVKMVLAAINKTSRNVRIELKLHNKDKVLKEKFSSVLKQDLIFILNYYLEFETLAFNLALKSQDIRTEELENNVDEVERMKDEISEILEYNARQDRRIQELSQDLDSKLILSREISLEAFQLKQELESITENLSSLFSQLTFHKNTTKVQEKTIENCHSLLISRYETEISSLENELTTLMNQKKQDHDRIQQLECSIQTNFPSRTLKSQTVLNFYDSTYKSLSIYSRSTANLKLNSLRF